MQRTIISAHTIEADVLPELLGASTLAGVFSGYRADTFLTWLRVHGVTIDKFDSTNVAFRCTAAQLHDVAAEARKYRLAEGQLATSFFLRPDIHFADNATELVRGNWESRGKTGFVSWEFDAGIVQLPEQDGDTIELTLYSNTSHTVVVDEENDPTDKPRKEAALAARKKRTSLYIGIPMVALVAVGTLWALGLASGLLDASAGKWAMISIGALTLAGMVGAVLGGLPAKQKVKA